MSNKEILISIIMPAYNAEKTIIRAIQSVICQNYSFWELIIINDGSIDNTLNICNEYIDNKQIIIHTQNNGGLSNARNKGIDLCQGDFICFLDSDDWYEKDYLYQMIHLIDKHASDLIVCNIIKHQNKNISQSTIPNNTYVNLFHNKAFLELFESGILNPAWNKLYRTNIIKTWNLLFPNIAIVEDLAFNLRYLEHCNSVSICNKALYHYDLSIPGLASKISEDMFKNYLSVHALFFSMSSPEYYNTISKSIYHQYLSLTIRYINKAIVCPKNKNAIFNTIKKYHNTIFVQHAFRSYIPKTIKESIMHYLLRFKSYHLVLEILKNINK